MLVDEMPMQLAVLPPAVRANTPSKRAAQLLALPRSTGYQAATHSQAQAHPATQV